MSVVSRDVRADVAKPERAEAFRPDIQGLRAIAVLAVVLNHAGISFISGGYVGVDVFFVISGYLISSHLLRSLDTDSRIHFGQFYARRARRILPASFVVLAASILGAFMFVPPLLREQVFRDAIATALYVPNYAFAVQGTDYLAGTSPSVFQHYWSLGVEEQFYLVWPLLLLATFLIGRRSRRAMIAVLGVVVAVSFTACIVLTWASQPWAFFSLWARAWELGVGGLIAALPLRRQLPAAISAVLGWLGLVGIVLACVLYSSRTAFPGFAATVPVVCAALVIFAGSSPSRLGPVALLRLRPLQFLGLISYSLYLVHWPILVLTQAAVGTYYTMNVWGMTGLIVASVPVAWLLYRFVENPARRSRWFAGKSRRALFAALGGSLVLLLVAVGGGAATAAMPLNSGRMTAASTPTDPPIATSFVPANLTPTLHHATKDNPSVYADGCEVDFADTAPHPCSSGDPNAKRIMLFGDSHAAQWYPALEKIASAQHYRIETETKSACPSVAVEISNKGLDYTACDTWRKNVIARLKANPPALVVISNYGNPVFENATDPTGQWAAGMRSTLGQLTKVTKVAVIADTPDFRVSPIICLSANLSSAGACARPADVVLDSPGRIPGASAANLKGATFVDLTGYFCSSTCPAIIGATTVYRDSHHLTATFAASMAPALWKRLRPILNPNSP